MRNYGTTDDWGDFSDRYTAGPRTVHPRSYSPRSEGQSSEPSDHVDDFGNTPTNWTSASAVTSTDEWSTVTIPERKPEPTVRRGGRNPYIGTSKEVLPVAPAPLVLPFQAKPRAAQPEKAKTENMIPPSKSFWDRVTPGSSSTPGEFFDDLEIPDFREFDIIPGKGEFKPYAIPGNIFEGIKSIHDTLPILLLAMVIKD